MDTLAVLLNRPKDLTLETVVLSNPGPEDLVVEIKHSGISTGTEKLFWSGAMPPFPGMGYPLVPGYEAAGEVVEAGALSGFKTGEYVFVPGANCFEGAHGLFGAIDIFFRKRCCLRGRGNTLTAAQALAQQPRRIMDETRGRPSAIKRVPPFGL